MVNAQAEPVGRVAATTDLAELARAALGVGTMAQLGLANSLEEAIQLGRALHLRHCPRRMRRTGRPGLHQSRVPSPASQIGAQDVREHQRVAGVGLLPRNERR